MNMLKRLKGTQTGRWFGVYVAFPLAPPGIELTWKFIGGLEKTSPEEVFPWTSLMAVFMMALYVVKNEVSKYNIPDANDEDIADKGHAKSRLESILMWLCGIFSCHVLIETIVNVRQEYDLYPILIGIRVLAGIILIWTLASFAAAQRRFRLKVAP